MPLPPETYEKVLIMLQKIRLEYFRADPDSVGPGGYSSLSWKVQRPDDPLAGMLSFAINGDTVKGDEGDMPVQTFATTTYELQARAFDLVRPLAHAIVEVDTSGCVIGHVPEQDIRQELDDLLDTLGGKAITWLPPTVEIDIPGIRIAVQGIILGGAAEVTVDLLIQLGVEFGEENGTPVGKPLVSYKKFDVDHELTPLAVVFGVAGAVVKKIVDEKVERKLKDEIRKRLEAYLNGEVGVIPPGFILTVLRAQLDAIEFVVCPLPPSKPSPQPPLPRRDQETSAE